MVRPRIEYTSPVWSPYTKQSISKLEMILMTAARWVKKQLLYSHMVTRMLDDLGWRLLENRGTDARLIMFHMIIYGLSSRKYAYIISTPPPPETSLL